MTATVRPRMPSWVWSLAPAAGILAVQQVLFPLSTGRFVYGVIVGGLTSLVALGMALTYRANRIINFAQADLGAAPVILAYMLITAWGWPYLGALAAGVAAAVVLGAVVELAVIRRFFRSPRLLLTVATLGLSQLLAAAGILVPRLWHRKTRLFSDQIPEPFDWHGEISGIIFSASHLIAIIAVPCLMAVLLVFLRYSHAGIAIRASADSADRASLLGVPVKRLQTLVWIVTSLLAFAALFLRSSILGLPVDFALSFAVLLRSLTALVLGKMTDLLAVATSGIALGVLEAGIASSPPSWISLDAILGVIILVSLLAGRRAPSRTQLGDASTWQTAEEVRPVAPAVARLTEVRVVRAVGGALALGAVLVLPHLLSIDRQLKASAVLIYAILGLSLVVLTGWAGQVSLGQVGFFAIGAAVAGKATESWGLDLSLAVLIAGAVGALAAVVVGLPALRLRGFYLAVTTLAFALAVTTYFLNSTYFTWVPKAQTRFERPDLFGRLDLESDITYFYVVLAALLLCLGALRGIRHSRTGRAIIALRDNERGAQAYGVSAIKVRLQAFALSGALAAIAGAIFVHHQRAIDDPPFSVGQNLAVFTMVIVGGVTVPAGAVLGALYLQGLRWFVPTDWQFLASGIGVLLVLLVLPAGLGSLVFRLRDRWLQWVADRHGVDAPGLRPETLAEVAHEEPAVLVGADD